MKVELGYYDEGWVFSLEPETETEKCMLNYLADRPKDRVVIVNTRLGLFKREVKDGKNTGSHKV